MWKLKEEIIENNKCLMQFSFIDIIHQKQIICFSVNNKMNGTPIILESKIYSFQICIPQKNNISVSILGLDVGLSTGAFLDSQRLHSWKKLTHHPQAVINGQHLFTLWRYSMVLQVPEWILAAWASTGLLHILCRPPLALILKLFPSLFHEHFWALERRNKTQTSHLVLNTPHLSCPKCWSVVAHDISHHLL